MKRRFLQNLSEERREQERGWVAAGLQGSFTKTGASTEGVNCRHRDNSKG
jgi:hypothetical protein